MSEPLVEQANTSNPPPAVRSSSPVNFHATSTQKHRVTRGRYLTSNDPRGYIPVWEYPVGDQWIMMDTDDGYVLWTAIWKALGNAKADIVKMLDSMPEISPHIRRVRGGYLKIQGTWMKHEIALDLARRVSYSIREDLIPIFGASFPEVCLKPDEPGYGSVLDGIKRRKRRAPPASSTSAVARQQDGASASSKRARNSVEEEQYPYPMHHHAFPPSSSKYTSEDGRVQYFTDPPPHAYRSPLYNGDEGGDPAHMFPPNAYPQPNLHYPYMPPPPQMLPSPYHYHQPPPGYYGHMPNPAGLPHPHPQSDQEHLHMEDSRHPPPPHLPPAHHLALSSPYYHPNPTASYASKNTPDSDRGTAPKRAKGSWNKHMPYVTIPSGTPGSDRQGAKGKGVASGRGNAAPSSMDHSRSHLRSQQGTRDSQRSDKVQPPQPTTLPLSSGATSATFHSAPHFDPALVPHPPPVTPPVGASVAPGGGTGAGRANESRPSSAGKSTGGMVAGRPFSKRSEEHPLGLPISSARDDSAVKGRNMSVGDGHEREDASQSQGEEGSDR